MPPQNPWTKRLSESTKGLSDLTSAYERQQKLTSAEQRQAQQQENTEARLQQQETNSNRAQRGQDFTQGVQLYQLKRQAELDWDRQIDEATRFIMSRADAAVANNKWSLEQKNQLAKLLVPDPEAVAKNEQMEMALKEVAQAFNQKMTTQTFDPDEASGAVKYNAVVNFMLDPKSHYNIANALESMGPRSVYVYQFIRDYAKTPVDQRPAAVQNFMSQHSVSTGLDPSQVDPMLKAVTDAAPPANPQEQAALARARMILGSSKDDYVRKQLGPYADYAFNPGSAPGGASGAPSTPPPPSAGDVFPLTKETSGELTGPIMKTGEHTYTNIAAGPVEGVNKPYLQKYRALLDMTQELQGRQAPAAGPGMGAVAPPETADIPAPASSVASGGGMAAAPTEFLPTFAAWTDTPGFKSVMQDAMTGAHTVDDVNARIPVIRDAVKAERKITSFDPVRDKNMDDIIGRGLQKAGLLNVRAVPQARAIGTR